MADGAASAPFLAYGRQHIDESDIAAVAEALRGDYLTTGPTVAAFEAAVARAVDAPEAVACSNGTAALHLAVMAAGLKPGDLAVVPAITFAATANACAYQGADVLFADVDPSTGRMTGATLAEALARADRPVRAILPVHLGGHAVEMAEVRAQAEGIGAVVIEDACHALGTETPSGQIGACPDSLMACFSLHPVKTLTTGEGGVITTRDPELAARMRRLRSHGMERDPAQFLDREAGFDGDVPNPWWHEQQDLGFNYRLPDVLCALGLSQLKRLPDFIARRRRLAALYAEALAPLAPAVRLVQGTSGTLPALHLLQVLIDFEGAGLTRRRLMERLHARGIGAQVHYIPVHRHPYWRARNGETRLPGAESFYDRTLSLPLHYNMTEADPARAAAALAEVLGVRP
ncbi:UDP-4-amino-4,6-dideoxy-N-acetyl-beta-L-altrosamine transaminase [Brevundimonas sp. 2R-24]|uniref:UDP-4-amino-4, 6-dideoxy-N-acetyl-beta-L-altrosamine transaminase n=1 Tax=Peiella sedimenti TaxID=3061083 RepID=A0ABT8SHL3_9CAUL|nr:UDP-4-amino-4,6-dideoxy-N-acetyl-beta-L-altrosamine transaminase [Caulobacteraceae bacterium XZ-24]